MRQRLTAEDLILASRPMLHRYCARMVSSAVDAEDVVQEVIVKVLRSAQDLTALESQEAWLVRVAHNACLDWLRRARRVAAWETDVDPGNVVDLEPAQDAPFVAAASFRTLARLPVRQRSAVILKDVLGYSLIEICGITDGSLPAVKLALQRGRVRLRQLASELGHEASAVSDPSERALLQAYVDRFNARDFDAIRAMLSEEVQLDLVARLQRTGRRDVGAYYSNYECIPGWRASVGCVDGRPAMLVHEGYGNGQAAYFVHLGWRDGVVSTIRDFRYARYAVDGADIRLPTLPRGGDAERGDRDAD